MNKYLYKRYLPAIITLLLLFASPAAAAMGEIQSFSFSGFGPGDILGPGENAAPDGTPDAVFSVSVTGIGALANFSISSPDGKSVWDTTAGNSLPGIHVQDGAGKVLTSSSGSMPITPFLLGAAFVLSVHDDGSIAKGGKFTLTAQYVDGSESTAAVEIAPSVEEQTEEAAEVKILSARWNDEKRDLTGDSETLAGNGSPDAAVRVVVQGSGKLAGVTVKSVKGDAAEWDTLPGNSAWLVAVTSSGKVLNRRDGSITADLKGRTVLDLRFTDNGAIQRGRSVFEVSLVFSDGSVVKRKIEEQSPGGKAEEFAGSAVLLGSGTRDIVGRNEKKAGNGKADLEAELRVETLGTVVAVAIQAASGAQGHWDTVPGNGKWLLAVSESDGAIVNRANGSVRIPVSRPSAYRLWFEDNNAFSNDDARAVVTLTYDDGRVLSRDLQIRRPGDPGEKTDQGPHQKKREVHLSSPRQASSSNYVGKGERPGRSGGKDWVFELTIRGEGTVKEMSLKGTSSTGMVVWDTVPGNGFSLLGAAAPGRGLLNRKNGTVSFDVPPFSSLMLFVEDDGFLRRRGEKQFTLTVKWSDGTVTESR